MSDNSNQPYEHIIRVCIESLTPLSIQGGELIGTEDANILTDANGLPMIPGKTLRGALRSLYSKAHDPATEQSCDALFGYQQNDKGDASNLCFDFGCVHDANNQPVTGLLSQEQIHNDQLLNYLQSLQTLPLLRERNAINARGAVKQSAKYNFAIAPKGLRYSFEISYETDQKERPKELNTLLSLIKSPRFRLGRNRHKNLGAFKVIHLKHCLIDKTDQSSIESYPTRYASDSGFSDITDEIHAHDDNTLTKNGYILKAVDFWRVGAGDESFLNAEKQPDLLPLSEQVICWDKNKASLKTMIVLPGTAVLGVLAHRLGFHYRCEQGMFAENQTIDDTGQFPDQRSEAETALFGEKIEHADQQKETSQESNRGKAGIIVINDGYLDPDSHCQPHQIGQQMHNKLSHHLGGTIDGALFSEELLYQTEITLEILQLQTIEETYAEAWNATLDDFFNGQLAIGAASGRGHGYFQTADKNQQGAPA